VHKLEAFTDQQRAVQQYVRGLIWWLLTPPQNRCHYARA
jgi:hypothetical protein